MIALSRFWIMVGVLAFAVIAKVDAANPPPTQVFYVPFPENDQLVGFKAVDTTNQVAKDPLTVFVTFAAATDGTVIYYDHWEDGYEPDITNPVQSTTLVFGDGNAANGYPPGNAADLIPAGTVFNLRNFVTTTSLQSVVDYDARDKIATFKPISITKTSFPDGTDTLMAGCVEMFERGLWGNEYRSPVGVDMPTSTATASLTYDEDVFSYVALSIMAGTGGASVQIDKNNDGTYEETVTLAEGETVYRDAVNVGGHILSDRPVQVVLFTGTIGSTYGSRDTMLLPVYRWSSDYFAPVTTPVGNGTVTYLYNPGTSAITVSYDYRDSTSTYVTATISVPAGGNARVNMLPANGTNHFGAYRFYTTGANPPAFYAISAIDADGAVASTANTAWDGGFTLVGKPSLTTQVLVSLGIGRDPYSATNPNENGNPIWITTSGNGHTAATVYVDYDGDNAGGFTDPNGNAYDISYSLRELQQQKIFDPDGDQSGMLIYTLNSSVRIAAMWGQDPTVATNSQPGIDVAALVPPLREGDAGKKSNLIVDSDGDGVISTGDTLEYDIRAINSARTNIPGPFGVVDTLPANVTYVPGSTRYRFSVGGSWQAWTTVPDSVSGTPFPLDDSGFSVPGTIGTRQQLQVVFNSVVKDYASLTGGTVTNTGQVEISPYGLVLPVEWTDTIYGSIGDRLWVDLDGDGVQDSGEVGVPGIDVFADLNNNGLWNTGEPRDTTDSNGNYLLAGLAAGTYQIRVDAADISAINVGYGPTYDLDGNATSNVASVVLAAAQERVDADFGYRVGASVGNRVWTDLDADGVQDSGEPGINGVRVYLDLNNNDAYDSNEPNTITSGDGVYYIGNLSPGTFAVRVDTSTLPGNSAQTYDLSGALDHEGAVTLIAAEHNGLLDFGYRGTLSIGDLVWEDINGDGLSTTTVNTTWNVDNGRVDLNNDSTFDNNDDGFIGTMQIINGYVDINGNASTSTPDAGDDGTFLGVNIVDGGFDLNGNGTISTRSSDDGTVTYTSTVSEPFIANVRVFIDANGNGLFDANEISAVTDASGNYTLGNLFSGTHVVRIDTTTLPSSFVATYDLTSPVGDHAATVVLSGASRTDADFGYRNDATLGDLVWNDRNADGFRDPGEQGIEGVIVYIDADGDNTFDQGVERYDITDVNGYYLIENLAAGTYAVRVEISTLPQGATQTYDLDGTGSSHEASRTLTTSQNGTDVDFGYRATAAFGNFVWNDTDADGVQDGGETGISGVRVYLDINGNGTFESASEPSALTDAAGAYSIANLLPGTYTARIDSSTLTAGLVQTYDLNGPLDLSATFFISATQTRDDIDFGFTTRISIGDLVWNDLNADGQKGAGEPGLEGVTVTAFNAGNDTIAGTTTSDVNGAYSFSALMPGTYYLIFGRPSGYDATLADRGADASDSDADPVTGRTPNVTLTGGLSDLTIDAGFYQPASIGDFVWNDLNANGQQDGGETGLSGVTVSLYRPGFGADGIAGNADDAAVITTATSDNGGAYSFSDLRPGTYQVGFSTLSGYNRTLPDQGVDTTDSDANAGTGLTATFAVAAGQSNNSIDAGYYQPGVITGSVFADTDNNNSGDVAIAGVILTLKDSAGNDIDSDSLAGGVQPTTTTTNASGVYTFSNLPPASYRVVETQPSGYLSVSDVDGLNNNVIGDQTPIVVAAGQTVTDRNFVEEQPGIVSGHLYIDTNGNGVQDGVEPDLANVDVLVTDSAGGTQTVTTNASGNWTATVQPGSTSANVQESDPQYPTGYLQTEGSDPTTVSVAAGASVSGGIDGYYQPATVTGHLYIDTNGNGTQEGGEPDLAGVDVLIINSLSGTQTVTTNSSGNWTASVPPGSTSANVQESDPQYPTGYTQTEGNDPTTFTAIAGASTNGGIDGYFLPGSITGFVLADSNNDNTGDTPLSGVVLTLLDSSGSPVLNVGNPVTTTTASNGSYTFGNLPPGTYGVAETQPSGYNSISDKDGGNLNEIRPITVVAGVSNTGNTFIEEQPGSISGTVFKDTDGDGDSDAPLANVTLRLLDNLGLPVLDGSNQPITTLSGVNGTYTFSGVSPGNYRVVQTQPANYNSVSDTDGANDNVIGNETPITVTAGNNNGGNNFIEIELGVISGYVLLDTDNNGSGDSSLPGVVLNLLDGSGNPVLDGYGDPIRVASGVGGYYSFTLVPVGTYRVSQNQPSGYGSVSDVDGANNNVVGDETPIVMTPGLVVTGKNFVEIQLGSISGLVYVDASPLAGVTLTLLDGSGNPIDGDPNTPGVQLVTTVTDSTGFYRFTGLMPGTYQVAQTQPFGYISSSDADGGDLDIIGDFTVITVLPGVENTDNDFIETPDTCPDTWAEWKFQHPGEQADGNPDADAYDNLNEFAFAMPPGSGAGNAWTIQPSALNVGTIEGVFIRPKGATLNVTYKLEYAAAPGNPTVWQSILITPAIITTSDNGDCTETVTIHGLESLTGLTGGKGVVRIRAELDEENDTVIDHTSHTEVEGWKETGFELCCRTYSNPFLRETEFTGTISTVNGQTIELPISAGTQDLGSLLFSGSYYLEVTSGDNEGHRFDVVSASGDSLTLATDTNLFENAPPHNSLTGPLPASLAGDTVVVRRHWTLGEMFPADRFGGTDDRATADQIQLFTDGQWTIYWLYNDGVSPQYWVKTGDNSYADQASVVIPPGQGLFFNNRAAVNSILAYGEVRNNDFIRPLATGSNLVCGGYPLDQSTIGREMNIAEGFFGSRDIATADTIFIWRADEAPSATGYDTYFLNNNAPRLPSVIKWVKIGDATLLSRDSELLLLGNRSVFIRSKNGISTYTTSSPWTP